jgi:DNA-binding CsgD family transcriptional regulator
MAVRRVPATPLALPGHPPRAPVAKLARKGLSNAEIAEALGGRRGTVKTYLTRIYIKVGVRSRADLVGVLASPDECKPSRGFTA